ncbi:hypothetical protein L9G16_04205 [Shewanella sp. A25]|nr:hypothetical protein [Shewanella shenzhenensis]
MLSAEERLLTAEQFASADVTIKELLIKLKSKEREPFGKMDAENMEGKVESLSRRIYALTH